MQERAHLLRDRVRRAHGAGPVPGVPRAHRRRQSRVRGGHRGRDRDGRRDAPGVECGQRPEQLRVARASVIGFVRPLAVGVHTRGTLPFQFVSSLR